LLQHPEVGAHGGFRVRAGRAIPGRDRAETLIERGHEFTALLWIDTHRDGRCEDLQIEKFLTGLFALASLIPDFELREGELGDLARSKAVTIRDGRGQFGQG
jgi:hypothetical protein